MCRFGFGGRIPWRYKYLCLPVNEIPGLLQLGNVRALDAQESHGVPLVDNVARGLQLLNVEAPREIRTRLAHRHSTTAHRTLVLRESGGLRLLTPERNLSAKPESERPRLRH